MSTAANPTATTRSRDAMEAVMQTARELTGEEAKEVSKYKQTITFTTTSGKRYKAQVKRRAVNDMFGTGYSYQVSAKELT